MLCTGEAQMHQKRKTRFAMSAARYGCEYVTVAKILYLIHLITLNHTRYRQDGKIL